ncbi:hypothetical protein KQX54_019244 [Cotesia glomerata]|uniref:Uncharacterized protein n=1 Tax=Cotesia glomerata TaxID=32391 RepID=A0AAV7IGU8_COTGL|nr:hypothetical protein KQX54_019244 [Cotesia glomerata]
MTEEEQLKNRVQGASHDDTSRSEYINLHLLVVKKSFVRWMDKHCFYPTCVYRGSDELLSQSGAVNNGASMSPQPHHATDNNNDAKKRLDVHLFSQTVKEANRDGKLGRKEGGCLSHPSSSSVPTPGFPLSGLVAADREYQVATIVGEHSYDIDNRILLAYSRFF